MSEAYYRRFGFQESVFEIISSHEQNPLTCNPLGRIRAHRLHNTLWGIQGMFNHFLQARHVTVDNINEIITQITYNNMVALNHAELRDEYLGARNEGYNAQLKVTTILNYQYLTLPDEFPVTLISSPDELCNSCPLKPDLHCFDDIQTSADIRVIQNFYRVNQIPLPTGIVTQELPTSLGVVRAYVKCRI